MREQLIRSKLKSYIEWPTLYLIITTYLIWYMLIHFALVINPIIWVIATGIVVTLFISITHEVSHRHPTSSDLLNSLLIVLPISWVIPYERFRDTHLQHHQTSRLTDPFDDPESWYVPALNWVALGAITRRLLEFNNTLFGRMLIGPLMGLVRFYVSEFVLIKQNPNYRTYLCMLWLKHLLLCMILVWLVRHIPVWQILASTYLATSLIMVRSFLEHQASENLVERTVIIEKCCPLAFLFLFNNLHVVHHERPGIPWYKLPKVYHEERDAFRSPDRNYVYKSYREVFSLYLFKMKEPVCHPFT